MFCLLPSIPHLWMQMATLCGGLLYQLGLLSSWQFQFLIELLASDVFSHVQVLLCVSCYRCSGPCLLLRLFWCWYSGIVFPLHMWLHMWCGVLDPFVDDLLRISLSLNYLWIIITSVWTTPLPFCLFCFLLCCWQFVCLWFASNCAECGICPLIFELGQLLTPYDCNW